MIDSVSSPRSFRLTSNGFRLGLASLIGLVSGVVLSKTIAQSGGPIGMARYGLILSVMAFVAMLADCNIGPGLVVKLSEAYREGDEKRFASYVKSARMITRFGSAVLVSLALLRWVLRPSLIESLSAQDLVWAAAAGAFSMCTNQELNILAGGQCMKQRSRLAMTLPLLGVGSALLFVVAWGLTMLAPGMFMGAFIAWMIATRSNHSMPTSSLGIDNARTRELLRFGAPMTMNVLVGFGVVTLHPILVSLVSGASATGLLKAAIGLSAPCIGWVTLLLTSDYLPRISRVPHSEVMAALTAQIRILLFVVTPFLAVLTTVSSWLLRILYTSEFSEVRVVLPLLFLGDLFRIAGWSVAYTLLAKTEPRKLFMSEFAAGLVLVCGTVVAAPHFGLLGVVAASALSALVYFVLVSRSCMGIFGRGDLRELARGVFEPLALFGILCLVSPLSKTAQWVVTGLIGAWALNGVLKQLDDSAGFGAVYGKLFRGSRDEAQSIQKKELLC